MKHILPDALRDATRLTQSGRLSEATAALQRLLGGEGARGRTNRPAPYDPPTIEGVAETVDTADTGRAPPAGSAKSSMLRSVLDQIGHRPFQMPGDGLELLASIHAPIAVPEGAQFLRRRSATTLAAGPTSSTCPAATAWGRPFPLSSCCTAAPSRPTTSRPARA